VIIINILKKSFYHVFALFVFVAVLVCGTGCNSAQDVIGSESLQTSADSGYEDLWVSSDSNDKNLLKVNYIDVGQADSILIQSPNGANMLIDAGETKENAVLNYLNGCGIKRLDVVVATHPHEDHISEMSKVIDTFEIGEFYMPKVQHTTKSFERMIDSLAAKDISPKEAKAGVDINFDRDVECHIVAPCKSDYDNLNNWSAVIKLTYGKKSFLFMGDAEKLSEKEIIESGADIDADVLKIGHHGSRSSTSEEFFRAVSPESVVISAGKDNDYGHPHKETMDFLLRSGVEDVFVTYKEGDIIVVSDGEKFSFNVWDKWKQNEEKREADIGSSVSDVNDTEITKENSSDESTQSYIGNIKSKKFHKTTCSNLPSEQNMVLFNSKSEAENQGYSPCGNCNP